MYSERLLALFHSRAHAGTLEDATHGGEAGVRGQGPYLELRLRVVNGLVEVARYRTFGCLAMIACGEALCAWGEGREITDRLGPEELAELAAAFRRRSCTAPSWQPRRGIF